MPKIAAKADISGLVRDVHNIFSVVVACGSRRSHSWAGYLGSVEQIPEIKCYFKFWMALLASFRR